MLLTLAGGSHLSKLLGGFAGSSPGSYFLLEIIDSVALGALDSK